MAHHAVQSTAPTKRVPHEEALRLLGEEFDGLDSALVAPIYFDTCDIDVARKTLKILSKDTSVEEGCYLRDTASVASDAGDWDSETEPTTLSLSSLRAVDERTSNSSTGSPGEFVGGRSDLEGLRSMFPALKQLTLEASYRKCAGNLERTVDELLTRAFLEERGEVAKGTDGFDQELNGYAPGKKKRKQKRTAWRGLFDDVGSNEGTDGSGSVSTAVPSDAASAWVNIDNKTQFIADALGLSQSTVISTYHANNGALPATIASLLDQHGAGKLEEDPQHNEELAVLFEIFGKHVNYTYLDRLLWLCHDKEAVFKLADILSHRALDKVDLNKAGPEGNSRTKKPIIAEKRNQASFDRVSGSDGWVVVGPSATTIKTSRPLHNGHLTRTNTIRASEGLSQFHLSRRNEAFAKAAEAYRRSRSDRLMGGAAAYYADEGKEHDVRAKHYDDVAAEQLVDYQSTEYMLDLHGVSVQQALWFARDRTTEWWLMEKPAPGSRKYVRPFVIVTGMGRRSKDGAPRIRPAVSEMLRREGWKIRIEQGQILVLGEA